MIRSYKYRLYPNRGQRGTLNGILETHRELYNAALQERRDAWSRCQVSVSYVDQAKQLTEIRRDHEDVAFLNAASSQQTLRRLDKAFKAFFRRVKQGEEPGYPRFKGRTRFKSVSYIYNDGVRLKDGRLYIHRVGSVRVFLHRDIPDGAKIKQVVLKRDGLGNWYAVFQLELPDPEPVEREFNPIGVDMGLEFFATLSDGTQIPNPRWFRASEQKLGVLQKRRSRCKRGSRQYRELTRQIRKLHIKIANQRGDFHHKLSYKLANEYTHIFVENLNVRGLARSHVAKSMGDAGWRQFLFMLDYKAEYAGGQRPEVDANGTSQTCPICGCIVKKSLSVRVHSCSSCGYVVPRDVASAQVIELRGLILDGYPRTEDRRKEYLQCASVGLDTVIPETASFVSVAGCPSF